MSQPISPWCLHWGRDGELAQSDRQDLLESLVLADNRLARLMLTQARQWSEQAGPQTMPQHSFYQP
ncbi:MAG: hypothetical protein ACKOPS_10475 [Cyanobium sp.]